MAEGRVLMVAEGDQVVDRAAPVPVGGSPRPKMAESTLRALLAEQRRALGGGAYRRPPREMNDLPAAVADAMEAAPTPARAPGAGEE